MWDFEHDPEQSRLAERYSIHRTMPSECAAELANGTADIGLIPIASYATIPGLAVIPGCTIASIDRVRSILLVVRQSPGVHAVKTVAADTSSLTSVAYTQILFRRVWQAAPEFIPHPPNLDQMLSRCDAALLIGDPALAALEDAMIRETRTGERLEYIDLAHEWRQHTSTPWVSAFWAVRQQALPSESRAITSVVDDFLHSRDHGLRHIGDIAAEWTTKIALSQDAIRRYLTENIHYVLDQDCRDGMSLFFEYAAQCGALPAAPAIKWL